MRQHSSASRIGLRFARHRIAIVSAVLLLMLAAGAALAPIVAAALGVDTDAVNLLNRFAPPSHAHPLGTDELGRDVLVRLLYGGRVSLWVGIAAALGSALIGTLVGLLAGFHGGRIDALLMRLTDGVIALPFLPLLIVLAALDLSKLGIPQHIATAEHVDLVRIVVIVSLVG